MDACLALCLGMPFLYQFPWKFITRKETHIEALKFPPLGDTVYSRYIAVVYIAEPGIYCGRMLDPIVLPIFRKFLQTTSGDPTTPPRSNVHYLTPHWYICLCWWHRNSYYIQVCIMSVTFFSSESNSCMLPVQCWAGIDLPRASLGHNKNALDNDLAKKKKWFDMSVCRTIQYIVWLTKLWKQSKYIM